MGPGSQLWCLRIKYLQGILKSELLSLNAVNSLVYKRDAVWRENSRKAVTLGIFSLIRRIQHFLLAPARWTPRFLINLVPSQFSQLFWDGSFCMSTDALEQSQCCFSFLNYQPEATVRISQMTVSGEPQWSFSYVKLKTVVFFLSGNCPVCIMNVRWVQTWSVIRRQDRDWKLKSCLSLLQSW